jgi:hypothetical protein
MKVNDLKTLLKERGHDKLSGLKKEELINLLENGSVAVKGSKTDKKSSKKDKDKDKDKDKKTEKKPKKASAPRTETLDKVLVKTVFNLDAYKPKLEESKETPTFEQVVELFRDAIRDFVNSCEEEAATVYVDKFATSLVHDYVKECGSDSLTNSKTDFVRSFLEYLFTHETKASKALFTKVTKEHAKLHKPAKETKKKVKAEKVEAPGSDDEDDEDAEIVNESENEPENKEESEDDEPEVKTVAIEAPKDDSDAVSLDEAPAKKKSEKKEKPKEKSKKSKKPKKKVDSDEDSD